LTTPGYIMLITFKTLQQKTFKIEIEETELVKVLKEKIFAERGNEFPVEGQKLIYAGKILDNDKPISEYSIDPVKNFVVVMAVKPKAKPVDKPKDSSSSTSTEPTSSSTTTTTQSSTTEAASSTATATTTQPQADSSTTTTTTTNTTSSTTPTTSESALLTGSELETAVTELMSLGYSREQVMRALNSSFHCADRAAEYLLSGNIPEIGESEIPMEGGGEDSEAIPAANISPAAQGDLNFLRNLPQFHLMRNQVQQHPETLPTLLQEIGRSNPQLLQLISQNQEAFIRLLNEPESGGGDATEAATGVGGAPLGGAGGGTGGFQIQVTPEEKASIDRIVSMGFAESEVIQAFFACDKNEGLTVEFLLSQ